MGAYTTWKNMVFEVVKKHFVEMSCFNKHDDDFYELGEFDCNDYHRYCGIIASDGASYKKYREDNKFFHGIGDISGYNSSTFRTKYIYYNQCKEDYEKQGENDLYLSIIKMGYRDNWYNYFSIITEGISCSYWMKKKKFLLFDGDIEMATTFSTFRELAVDGYNIDNDGSITLSTNIDDSLYGKLYCKKRINFCDFSWKFSKFLPEVVQLYNDNEELYEDALDEITERYPKV